MTLKLEELVGTFRCAMESGATPIMLATQGKSLVIVVQPDGSFRINNILSEAPVNWTMNTATAKAVIGPIA